MHALYLANFLPQDPKSVIGAAYNGLGRLSLIIVVQQLAGPRRHLTETVFLGGSRLCS